MNIKVNNLKNDRQWKAATGYSSVQFYKLLEKFKNSYIKLKGSEMSDLREGMPNKAKIKSYEDLLFFTLFALKSGLNYDLLGLMADMDNSNAKRNLELGLLILKDLLSEHGYAPKREFETVEQFEKFFRGTRTLIIDGTEQRIQRPGENQKDFYSGKKNATP